MTSAQILCIQLPLRLLFVFLIQPWWHYFDICISLYRIIILRVLVRPLNMFPRHPRQSHSGRSSSSRSSRSNHVSHGFIFVVLPFAYISILTSFSLTITSHKIATPGHLLFLKSLRTSTALLPPLKASTNAY
jgi:hypothetical protein